MKKILLMLCVFIITTGCVNIKKEEYKNIINNAIKRIMIIEYLIDLVLDINIIYQNI